MSSTRSAVVSQAKKYIGVTQGSAKHKEIVNTFNKIKPHGEVGNYYCPWCAIFATAMQYKAGNGASVVPQSYNCGTLIDGAKKLGIWVENDNHKPSAGDMIIYYWSAPAGNCNSGASHVGIVEKVSGNTITVIEGNMGSGYVGRRSIPVGWRYIRGFIAPKYKTVPHSYSGAYPILPARGYFRVGSKGKQVERVQHLVGWVIEKSLDCDGIYGAKTKEAVKLAQKKLGVKQDGLFGRATLKACKNFKR